LGNGAKRSASRHFFRRAQAWTMATESVLPSMKLTPHLVMEQIHLHGWNWKSAGAVCGLCLGIISPLVGSALTAMSWVIGPHWHGFSIQRYGTVLFFLTIPLLIFGAHCLDLLDREDERAKNRHLKNSVNGNSLNEEKHNDLERY
jgi:hypothetical protein